MVSVSVDTVNGTSKAREALTDLSSAAARETQPSPLASLSSSHPIARQFAALELNLTKIFDVIDGSVADANSPIQRVLREVISADGISITYPQSINAEATLQIVDQSSGTTLQFRWGSIEGEQLSLRNAKGDKELLYVDVRHVADSDQPRVTLKRVDGDNVVAINDLGVRVCDPSERRTYIKSQSEFVLQSDRAANLSERAASLLHSLSAGRFGSEINLPVSPELPGRVVSHEGLLKHFAQLNQMLEKAAQILTPANVMA